MNEYCARKLAAPGDPPGGPGEEAVERAAVFFGHRLIGVLVYGSWVRDELTGGSDVDLLVVLDSAVPITRALYREWDEKPLTWRGHAVEPHFVHPPEDDARITGVWAEAATEGMVLFEREMELSRRLARIRRRILKRGLVRRRAHGQPYWVEAG